MCIKKQLFLPRLLKELTKTKQQEKQSNFLTKKTRYSIQTECQALRCLQGTTPKTKTDQLNNGLNIAKLGLAKLTPYLLYTRAMSTDGSLLKCLIMTTKKEST